MTQEEQASPGQGLEERFGALAVFLARTLVPDEDVAITANAWTAENTLKVILNVEDSHRGRLIGRNGHMIRSLRTLVAHARVEGPLRVELDIAE